jgi:hypothetical protein
MAASGVVREPGGFSSLTGGEATAPLERRLLVFLLAGVIVIVDVDGLAESWDIVAKWSILPRDFFLWRQSVDLSEERERERLALDEQGKGHEKFPLASS